MAADARGYAAELPEQGDPAIGQELIRVRYADGRTEDLRLHDYGRVYSIPGLYEQIVHERLGCSSPRELTAMLAAAVDGLGWERQAVGVIDLAAGNGISGQALADQNLRPVLGTDILPEAREAALRDRPGVYDAYETLDLLALSHEQRQAIARLQASAVSCVAPVGDASQQLPPAALAAVVKLLAPDALIAYMHDPMFGVPDTVADELRAGKRVRVQQLGRKRYLHRRTLAGRPYKMDGVILRVQRD